MGTGLGSADHPILAVYLAAEGEIEAGDGELRRISPGLELLTKDTTGQGHRVRVTSEKPSPSYRSTSEFANDMGHNPVSASGTLRNPNGGCSTPGDVEPDPSAGACQTHDLGYDLLRYAEKEGTRLDARARLELDGRLYVDLSETCETPTCSLTATAYYCAVSANSIRQGYKAPHAGPTTPWMALVMGVLGTSTACEPPVIEARFDHSVDRPR